MVGLRMIRTKSDVRLKFFGGLFEASKESVHQGIFVERFHFSGHFIASVGTSVPEVSIHGNNFVLIKIFRLVAVDVILFEILHGFYYNKRN
jgi:hypothetical protein